MSTYYKDQLEKIQANSLGHTTTIKITNNGVSTNWLSLNSESATQLVIWLKDNYTIVEDKTKFGGGWSIEDIKYQALEVHDLNLNDEQAVKIARDIEYSHDAEIGINWDVINHHIEMFIENDNL